MRENYYLDDGTYSASQIIVLMVRSALAGQGRDVSARLLSRLREPAESKEFRLRVPSTELGQRILAAFHDWVSDGGAPDTGSWQTEWVADDPWEDDDEVIQ